MKTIPVSLIVAGLMIPVIVQAQPKDPGPGGPPPENQGERKGGKGRGFADFWKAMDKDHDGFLSKEEFAAMPRIENLPEEKRDSLFKRFDKNSDGKLGRDEFPGNDRDDKRPPFQRLWELDVDKSGGVSLDEFKAGEFFKKLPPEKQEAVFKRLDTNGDGMITAQDKPEMPFRRDGDKRSKHPDGPPRDPRQIISQLDTNKDGSLSFEEFRVGPGMKNLTEDQQEDRFEEMDKNHDQKLTADDFPPPPPRDEPCPEPPPAPPAAKD
jgi:Ca2+-binding EF-hand superfamily protein